MSQALDFGLLPLVVVWSPDTLTSESTKSQPLPPAIPTGGGGVEVLVPKGFVHTALGVVCPAGAGIQVSRGKLGEKAIREIVVPIVLDGSGWLTGTHVSSKLITLLGDCPWVT